MDVFQVQDESKTRVLFVDDEDAVLSTLRLIMRRMGPDWEAEVASSGAQALQAMAASPYDILVSDMRMPGMTGMQLLQEVLRKYPRTVRIILSGYADEEAVMQCAGATHQWLAKPFSPLHLQLLLRRIRALQQRMRNLELQALVSKMSHLPSLPSIYFKISEALQSPRASSQAIGELVSEDPSLTVKVLQLANSAAFGFQRSVVNATEGVQLLGINCVRSLALAHHLFSAFQNGARSHLPLQQIWDHCLRTASLARRIMLAERSEPQLVEQAFTAGLVHDIGKLILAANVPAEYIEVWARAQSLPGSLLQAELEAFQATHAEVGAYLLGIWGLPVPLMEAVAWHHQPGRNSDRSFSPLTAVHVANILSRNTDLASRETGCGEIDSQYLTEVGVVDRLPAWRSLFSPTGGPRPDLVAD